MNPNLKNNNIENGKWLDQPKQKRIPLVVAANDVKWKSFPRMAELAAQSVGKIFYDLGVNPPILVPFVDFNDEFPALAEQVRARAYRKGQSAIVRTLVPCDYCGGSGKAKTEEIIGNALHSQCVECGGDGMLALIHPAFAGD